MGVGRVGAKELCSITKNPPSLWRDIPLADMKLTIAMEALFINHVIQIWEMAGEAKS